MSEPVILGKYEIIKELGRNTRTGSKPNKVPDMAWRVLNDYGSYKGRRGGSWGSGVDQIQSASIFSDKPKNANDVTGFRCVLPMP